MNAERGIGTIFSELLGEITALIRNEIRLAKAEVAETIRRMLLGVVLALAGLFIAILALVFLLQAAVGGLMLLGLNFALSSLIVAVAAVAISGVVVWLGISRLKIGKLSQSKTAQQIKRDAATVRSQVQGL
ncbi:MAG: phage holin family protein [Alphaproteobacteria bacterium]|nr:phage holin family protein [Alphaproteobacteria bacterium]MBV9061615.1 phage holin family protein [Alphaproteobacteria bacterium]